MCCVSVHYSFYIILCFIVGKYSIENKKKCVQNNQYWKEMKTKTKIYIEKHKFCYKKKEKEN